MSELSKAYEPAAVEAKWRKSWEERACFVADPARVGPSRPAYSIVIPPPNVTGVLTLGHVLNNTVQDILARKARMEGKEVLWLPGCDHAGIATQTVVERSLKKAGEIRHRDDLGRERFLKKVWEWKEKHGGIITEQLRRLGASCDWSRERFTMDAAYSRCVQSVFVDLFAQGLIYRGRRMVHWCPASLTALSDEEVVMKQQKGALYYFRVEVDGEPGAFLSIATTRPETIPADTAIAVNPKDARYAHWIGRRAVRALPAETPRHQRLIPIIGDESVDFEFGTGVLKVTPAHDRTDFEIGLRHGLPIIEALNPDGTLNENAGEALRGLDRFKGRVRAVEILRDLGALEKEEPHTNNVGFSERADVPIEPRLSDQWFLKYPQVGPARAAVAEARMRFFPDRWAKVYDHWMANLQDWCISRQLWWGHRIPVWTRTGPEGELPEAIRRAADSARPNLSGAAGAWSVVRRPGPASGAGIVAVATQFPEEAAFLEAHGFAQDPDVLDTWFSSWLWPFATMGWPDKTATLSVFYPTTDLVTGPDIIFFWVARMIVAGYEFMGRAEFGLPDALPFRNVYFTGIIRDKQGRKMSKSLGNSPDPLDLIARFGADALRFGVMRAAPLGQDVLFDEQAVELGRNFCNKLWNACRFRQMQSGDSNGAGVDAARLSVDDRWILRRLDQAVAEVTDAFAGYRFSEAAAGLYRFFWSEYCDWYLEAVKPALAPGADAATAANTLAVVDRVLATTLRLFHPFLPHITEELWHGMGYHAAFPAARGGDFIGFAPWPAPLSAGERLALRLDEGVDVAVGARNELVTAGRNLKTQANLGTQARVRFVVRPAEARSAAELEILRVLLHAESVEAADAGWQPPKGALRAASAWGELHLPLAGLIDFAAERARLNKEIERVRAEITKVREKLANPAFSEKAPPAVLDDHRRRLADWESKEQPLVASLAALPE